MNEFRASNGTVFRWKPDMQGDTVFIRREAGGFLRRFEAASIPARDLVEFVTQYQTPTATVLPKLKRLSKRVTTTLTLEQALMLVIGARTSCAPTAQDARDIVTDLLRMGYEVKTSAELGK